MNVMKPAILCVFFVGLSLSSLTDAFAQLKIEPRLAVEKEITVEKDLQALTNTNPFLRPTRKFKLFDFETLEVISSREEPSRIYEILPHSPSQRNRLALVNLYRNDLSSDLPFRIDMRVSSKLSFETRSPYIDSLMILDPFQKRVSLGLGHKFNEDTSISAFFDPIHQDMLGIIAKRINSFTEINLLGYHSQKTGKSDAIVSLKFIF